MTANRLAPWLLVLTLLVAAVPRLALGECVVGTAVNVREEPRVDARVTGVAPVGLPVTRSDSQDGWAKIGPWTAYGWVKSSGEAGWVREEFLAPQCPSFPEVVRAAKDQDAVTRAAAYERAA